MKNTRYFITAVILIITIAACNSNSENADLNKDRIKFLEDSITKIQKSGKANNEDIRVAQVKLMEELKAAYEKDKDGEKSVEYLTKLHMGYSAMGIEQKASEYAEELLNNKKDFPNRATLIQSQILSYDEIIVPRDTNKLRYYIEMYIHDYPKAEETIALKERLKYLNLTFSEWLDFQIQKDIQ